MLEIFELEELFLEASYDGDFVLGFSLLQQTVCCQVSIHLLIEFYLEINYHSNPSSYIRTLLSNNFEMHYRAIFLMV